MTVFLGLRRRDFKGFTSSSEEATSKSSGSRRKADFEVAWIFERGMSVSRSEPLSLRSPVTAGNPNETP